jgi:hypothetical protein
MDYNVYLKYNAELDLNLSDYYGGIYEHVFADIMYETEEIADDEEDYDYEATKIGFMSWIECNQALAMAYGVSMAEIPYFTMRTNSDALMELDHTRISQETINEIGAAKNPNIILLVHFGISAVWRSKGIGEQVLKEMMKQMKGKYGYIIALNSVPEQHEEDAGPDSKYEKQGVGLAGLEKDPEKAQWKLNAFFQRCGFRLFKNYNNVFVCNIEQAVPERIKVTRPVNKLI